MGRIERGGGGVAANPLGAHQVGRGFADCVTAHVVAIFAGVPRIAAARHACFNGRLSFMPPSHTNANLRKCAGFRLNALNCSASFERARSKWVCIINVRIGKAGKT